MEKKLDIKNLRVSFRTNEGTVKAVRDIDLELYKGETLAIVGESGSGKSVTAKAVLGILAPNSIIESGEIIYDGKDLLKISEDEFHNYRGNKLSMIFQDPMSSLNPIMKIGKQLTEAMILNGKANQKAAKKEYKFRIKLLKENLQKAGVTDIDEKFDTFDKIISEDIKLEKEYNESFLSDFIETIKIAIEYSYTKSYEAKKEALKVLEANISSFENAEWEKPACTNAAKAMTDAVNNSIDKLAIKKESTTYTFSTSIMSAIERYFSGIISNKKNRARYEKQNAKIEKLRAKGKITRKVTPAVVVDLELIKSDTIKLIKDLVALYKEQVSDNTYVDFNILSDEMVEHLKKQAVSMVYKVTPIMAKNRAIKLMEEVGIPQPEKRYKQFPFQFSGGMRQRIVIAIALSANPDILICDEPTTALDVTIQAQILELINELKAERQLSVIFITHDLGVVANMADRIAVMYAGKIVEIGTADEIFYEPAHPYTWALLASMPDLDTKEKLDAIPGTPPNMLFPPVGDAFATRNKYAMQIDFEEQPPLFEITPTHYAATWLLHPNAPKVEPPRIVTDRIERMKNMNAEVAEDA